ncbi:MAG: cation transporter [Muribaculaceae bacterium]|nr:cation transporter [Muribaculaceae bacterium]MCM1478508.1 cation transporter [Muribaculaceae bacterium]
MKKLSHGCCGAGGDDEKSPEKSGDFSEYGYKYTVKIGGMSCKNCAAKIENTFGRKDGIAARADFKSGTAEIFSNAPVTEFTIRQTVVGLGYSVESIVADTQ